MVFLYPGAIHVHSTYSDGTGTIEEIAKAAKKAGLSWVVVTDHNNMKGKEGIYDGVCVIIGEEISPDGENHYLALGIKTPISPDMLVVDYIRQVKKQGGFGFVAHPDENEFRKNSYKAIRWLDWTIKDFGGIEIWNQFSNWADYYDDKNLFKIIKAFLFRNNVLSGPTDNVLAWWDNLNNENKEIIPAIGGVDAHALKIKKMFLTVKIFPYQSTFGTITNFIHLDNSLPEDFESRKNVILNAIKLGKNLIMNRVWNVSSSCGCPIFCIKNEFQKVYDGDYIKLDSSTKMIINLPRTADVRVIHNGNVILQDKIRYMEFDNLSKGKYRLEVYYKNRPWIFSNPIVVE